MPAGRRGFLFVSFEHRITNKEHRTPKEACPSGMQARSYCVGLCETDTSLFLPMPAGRRCSVFDIRCLKRHEHRTQIKYRTLNKEYRITNRNTEEHSIFLRTSLEDRHFIIRCSVLSVRCSYPSFFRLSTGLINDARMV